MSVKVVTATSRHHAEWLRLRNAVYTGIDRAFHEREMALYLRDDTKECFLAVGENRDACGLIEADTLAANSADSDVGENRDACGLIEVSLRNVVDGCLSSPVG